eukprot:COSAG02_NODE_3393_length_6818_cov_13.790743_2_plen_76_part_01
MGNVARSANLVADSLQIETLEKVDVSSARISLDAGRSLDAFASERLNVRGGNVTAEADVDVRILAGASVDVITTDV